MQRYTIFNKNNKVLLLKSFKQTDELLFDSPNNLLLTKTINCNSEDLLTKDFSIFFNDEDKEDVEIVCQNIKIEELFKRITSQVKYVEAAGGIVTNEDDEILFIFRNGFWDLAKGHREEGEQLSFTAKREVMEECGMNDLKVKKYLTSSFHSYTLKGKREIKQTYWYKMFCSKKQILIPQTSEGITLLKWVKKQDIDNVLVQTYPSIQYLFSEIRDKI